MKKTILIIVIVSLGILSYLAFSFTQHQDQTQPLGGGGLPVSGGGGTDDAPLTIRSATNETVLVRDFLSDPRTLADPANEGSYFLGNHFPSMGTEVTVPPEYVITYVTNTNYFNIGLFSEPIGLARVHAENDLMQQLGITEAGMCSLRYMVSTPVTVNEEYAGLSLGFSFCPGSVVLP